ncbi:pleckstrin y domain-containing family A member 7 [Caerostris extrusa]|uniref:Pleckstrin y domain-containing family A member 7 n=1 Tax=Caerostris extrusa TaxID=172846 RepID=A0AAV4NH19_CAEEX|nr:pleckstrin y domain-containing family A member 7 [Caerostris extrusa]
MKTYYFAAEDKENMKRWMNAMSLASIMQNFVRSENYDATFSSASNDDEDCGFTSYRSRRYTSQKLNSTYDPNFSTEPLKQRSNSYGDRMGEVYLEVMTTPRRQPLYANAPPKPRRLTQSDYSYYDGRDLEIEAIQSSQYPYDKSEIKMYADHHKDMAYHPLDQNPSYMPGSDPALMHAEMQCVDNYPSNLSMETVPDLYKNQPPRPRSADFLERDADCGTMPDVAMYSQNRQPQRPKSSLEYYDRYDDSEDCNFDYYREAVRIQADNLYANKNLNKPKKHQSSKHAENIVYKDPQNNPYSDAYIINDQISPCYASGSKISGRNLYSESHDMASNPLHNEYYDSKGRHSKPKKNKEESMQRLLEWKQRMLQKDQEAHGISHSSTKPTDYIYAPTNPNPYGVSLQKQKDHRRRHESSNSQKEIQYIGSPVSKFSDIEHSKFSPQLPDPNLNSNLNVPAENLYKENIMYCVDSENNEIIFSYDDSPSSQVPKSLQTCHYPPQMHSFTTMPNVSNIGNDSRDFNSYDANESSEYGCQKKRE